MLAGKIFTCISGVPIPLLCNCANGFNTALTVGVDVPLVWTILAGLRDTPEVTVIVPWARPCVTLAVRIFTLTFAAP
jgi:hypothetical protein